MSEIYRAIAIGNMLKKFGENHTCGSGDILMDRQTHTHADILIRILCNHSGGWSNNGKGIKNSHWSN